MKKKFNAKVADDGADYRKGDDHFLSVGGYRDGVSMILGIEPNAYTIVLSPEEALQVAQGIVNSADACVDQMEVFDEAALGDPETAVAIRQAKFKADRAELERKAA